MRTSSATLLLMLLGVAEFAWAIPPGDATDWTAELVDEFGTLDLTTTWYPREGEKNGSTCRQANISCADGHLKLKIEKEGSAYYCAGVITQSEFKYGYYEISAKLPQARGWHPAFWTFGGEQEIDIFEFNTGVSSNGLHPNLHDNNGSGEPIESWPSTEVNLSFDPEDAFHTYAAQWDKFAVRYFVDDDLIDIKTFPEGDDYQHGNQTMRISVIKSSTGSFYDADLPDYFEIDYAKIWSRNEEDGPDTPLSLMFVFNEGSGNAQDSSDKGHTGVLYGDACYSTDATQGSHMSFDAAGDYVEVTDDASLDDTTELTLSAWIKPANNDSTLKGIVSKRNSVSDCAYLVFARDGKIHVDINAYNASQRVSTTSAVLTANAWNHLAVVYDGGAFTEKVKIFINGVKMTTQGTETDTAIVDTCAANLHIGSFNDRNESFNGQIDDLRIWKRALSDDEVGMFSEDHLAVNFQFEDGNGIIAHDMSSNGCNGTLNNVWWTTDAQRGDYAMQFLNRGFEAYIRVPDSDQLDDTSELTLMAWLKPSLIDGTYRGLFCKRNTYLSENAYSIFYKDDDDDGDADIHVDIDGFVSSERTTAADVLSNGDWVHLAIVFDSGEVRIYIDGVPQSTSGNEQSTSIPNEASDLFIGAMQHNGASFQGLMDDVRIYRAALTTSEIQAAMGN